MKVRMNPLEDIRERMQDVGAHPDVVRGLTTNTWMCNFVDRELDDIGVVNTLELSIHDYAQTGVERPMLIVIALMKPELLRAMVRDEDGDTVEAVYREIFGLPTVN